MNISAEDILKFWFEENGAKEWFTKDDAFDAVIRERFSEVHKAAMLGELKEWRTTPQGRLAEIIVLDQFSRNLYRDQPQAFACDETALALAQEAIAQGYDKQLSQQHRWFLYLPFMHSESRKVHKQAVRLFEELGMDDVLDYEFKHKQIIDRFGRYPHRNVVLDRPSTTAEKAFLKEPGSTF